MSVQYFLGANSAYGFYSLYDGFASDAGDRIKLIKGGPGCGKSSFMRAIAAAGKEHGFEVEYILCSGDPDSLDGIYFPELGLGYADATAPHALEPRHFAYDSCYVNLGAFCSDVDDDGIPQLYAKYREMYTCAYSYLAAAGSVLSVKIPEIFGKTTVSGVISCAKSAAKLTADAAPRGDGREYKRFIRCIGCRGVSDPYDTVSELCKQTYLVDDRFGLEDIYFKELQKQLGGKVICCPSPLLPERTEAILLPDDGIAFVSASLMPTAKAKRRIRLSALVPSGVIAAHADELRRRDELKDSLISQAVAYLEKAKRCHDELEAAYRDSVDFDALDAFTADEIRLVFD